MSQSDARMPEGVVERVVPAVRRDLEDGTWDARYGHLRQLDAYDAGLRLVAALEPDGPLTADPYFAIRSRAWRASGSSVLAPRNARYCLNDSAAPELFNPSRTNPW